MGAPWLQGSSHSLGSLGLTWAHCHTRLALSLVARHQFDGSGWIWAAQWFDFLSLFIPGRIAPSRPQVLTGTGALALGPGHRLQRIRDQIAWPRRQRHQGHHQGRPTEPSDQRLQLLLPRALQARTSQPVPDVPVLAHVVEKHVSTLPPGRSKSCQLPARSTSPWAPPERSGGWVHVCQMGHQQVWKPHLNTDLPPGSPDTGPVSTWILLRLVLTNLWHQHAVLWICHPRKGQSENLCGFGGHEVAMNGYCNIVKNDI